LERRRAVNTNPEVDAWFAKRRPPLEETMQRAREIILRADSRVEECIKWSTPTFTFDGNIASFNPAKTAVSILFHRGAEIPGDHPRLEGDARLVRVMRFSDVDDVEAARGDLEAVIRAWCAWKTS
jgi:hypothetical protein